MANRYYVNGTGSINDTFHWSLTSGGAGGASIPTSTDNVFFDNGSSAGSYVVTLNATFNCLDLDFTNTKTCTFTSSVYSANIYGSLTLWTGLTWSFTGTAYTYIKPTFTSIITTNGSINNAFNILFLGASSSIITYADNFRAQCDIALVGGINVSFKSIWNTNNKNVNIQSQSIYVSSGIIEINAGSSNITCKWIVGDAGNAAIFNCGTSTITMRNVYMYCGDLIYYNVTKDSADGTRGFYIARNGATSVLNITGTLTINGLSQSSRLLVKNYSSTIQATITVDPAKVFASNCDFQDIKFTNPIDLSNIVGGSQDFGNNTNITFTPGINCYYKGTTGAHNWSTNWKLADRITTARVPLIQDNAKFDNLSFTGPASLVLDIAATCKNIDFTGIDKALTLSSSVNSLKIYGDTTLAPNLTWNFTGTAYTYMSGLGSFNITTNGNIANMNRLYLDRVGGTWTNQDNFNIGSTYIGLTNGTWNTNNKIITTINDFEPNTGIKTLILGSTVFNCRTFGMYNATTNLTFIINCGTSVINCINFIRYCKDYDMYDVNVSSTLNIGNNSNSNFHNIIFVSNSINGNTFLLQESCNITITNIFTCKGYNSNINRILLSTLTIGMVQSITAANVVFENVDFRDIKGLGTANWNLSAIPGGSGDCGGNSNIIFTPSVTQYYKHTLGACNWSDPKWYSDITPRTTVGRVPLPQDDVIFDGSSFTGTSTLSVNVPRICRSLDMSRVSQNTTYVLLNDIEVYGNFILGDTIIPSGNKSLQLMGKATTYDFNTYNKTLFTFGSYGNYINRSNITLSLSGLPCAF